MFTIYITLLCACFLCFIMNRKKLPHYFAFCGVLVFVVIGTELIKQQVDANPVNHLYQLVELWLISLMYYEYYKENKNYFIVTALPLLLIVLTTLHLFISFYVEGIYNESTLGFIVNSLLTILLSTFFFYDLYSKNTEINIASYGFFWINAGNLLYACGTFFQMGLYAYVKKINPVLADELNLINQVLNYFLYVTYLVGFLCTVKQASLS